MTSTNWTQIDEPAMWHVGDVVRPAVAVPAHASFKRILRTMISGRARAVPVVNPDGRVIGVVSDADLLSRAIELRGHRSEHHRGSDRHSEPLTAAHLMTAPALTTSPEQSVGQAARALAAAGVRQLVVVDRTGRLLGLVGRSDLIADFDRDDAAIQSDVVHEVLVHQFCVDPTGLDVVVGDGIVTITGQVEHQQLARLIGAAIAEVPGVLDVVNRLTWPEPPRRLPLSSHPIPFHAT